MGGPAVGVAGTGGIVHANLIDPGIGPVQQAEAVTPGLHLEIRPGPAVDHDDIAEKLRVPEGVDGGVRGRPIQPARVAIRKEPLAVSVELPVLKGDLDFLGSGGEIGRVSRAG